MNVSGCMARCMRCFCSPTGLLHMIISSNTTWIVHGVTIVLLIASGRVFSFQRPAADIFCVGAVQVVPTIFVVVAAWLDCSARAAKEVVKSSMGNEQSMIEEEEGQQSGAPGPSSKLTPSYTPARSFFLIVVFFMFNSPLIVVYPWFVHWKLALGVGNSILHAWLSVAWIGQWWVLERGFINIEV